MFDEVTWMNELFTKRQREFKDVVTTSINDYKYMYGIDIPFVKRNKGELPYDYAKRVDKLYPNFFERFRISCQ